MSSRTELDRKNEGSRASRRRRIAANPGRLCPPDHRHGDASTCYNTHGCRCEGCRMERQRKRQRPDWEARRLAGKGVLVPALGAKRRLEALAYMGWSAQVLAERIGSHYRPLMKIRAGEKASVKLANHHRIDRVFRELAMLRAPGHSGMVTRGKASRSGYVPAVAWDDIDDPGESPQGVGVNRGPDVERIAWLARDGLSDSKIADALGMTKANVFKVRKREGIVAAYESSRAVSRACDLVTT